MFRAMLAAITLLAACAASTSGHQIAFTDEDTDIRGCMYLGEVSEEDARHERMQERLRRQAVQVGASHILVTREWNGACGGGVGMTCVGLAGKAYSCPEGR